jgi:hypothetical protein
MIYTAAFVQNDLTKEVMNCDKGRDEIDESVQISNFVGNLNLRRVSATDEFVYADPQIFINPASATMGGFNYELFEGEFPGEGWMLMNPDGGITFEQIDGVNGPLFDGNKSIWLDFYSYSTVGARDTLYTKVYAGLDGNDSVKFDYAHAEYPNFGPDRLIINLSVDGGITFPFTIFDKSGNDLATVPATTASFTPSNPNQWATYSYPLEAIVPVELTSFYAEASGSQVSLYWSTASETNNQGFEIERSAGEEFLVVGFVEGKGTTTETTNYSFTDAGLENGSYSYRLKQVDYDGTYEYSDETFAVVEGPVSFSLQQNYPNPFNPVTLIKYSIPKQDLVSVKVFDATGQEVASLMHEVQEPGSYTVTFDGSTLSSGVYFYRIIAGDFNAVKKMSLIK